MVLMASTRFNGFNDSVIKLWCTPFCENASKTEILRRILVNSVLNQINSVGWGPAKNYTIIEVNTITLTLLSRVDCIFAKCIFVFYYKSLGAHTPPFTTHADWRALLKVVFFHYSRAMNLLP
jgi:hypothetical protein